MSDEGPSKQHATSRLAAWSLVIAELIRWTRLETCDCVHASERQQIAAGKMRQPGRWPHILYVCSAQPNPLARSLTLAFQRASILSLCFLCGRFRDRPSTTLQLRRLLPPPAARPERQAPLLASHLRLSHQRQ